MAKIWKLDPSIPEDISEKLSEFPQLLRQLLFNRGLVSKEKIEEFLEPKYEKLHNPFLFLDMQKCVDRIWEAIDKGEKICIYGDYDADAVTANAVLCRTFEYLGVKALAYIPDRFTEGYGVNLEALQKIKDNGSKIIITVDCGTNSTDAADWCKENGIDFIITDHHEIIGEKPRAFGLINPKNHDDNYPYSEITGVAVAFKLASAILSVENKVVPRLVSQSESRSGQPATYVAGWEKWLLDLVAIGTVADCHSLIGENRILVKYGLKVLEKTRWPGMQALINLAGLDFHQKAADTYALGFVIAPRLNAAGRLEHAGIALDLLLEQNPALAKEKAEALNNINLRRQKLTETVMSEAKEKVLLLGDRKVLVVVGEGWPKGVVGLVAGKLAEEYYKPTIVLERTELICTGSARTAGDFDIIEALKHASNHLVKFGGHKQAAGMTLEFGQFEMFYQKVLEYAEPLIKPEDSQRVLHLEAELSSADLSLVTCDLLLKLEPFGVDNHKPKFLIPKMKIISSKTVGAQKQHSQYQLQKGDRTIAGIAFNSTYLEKNFKVGDTVDVAAELIEDGWNGRKEVKLRVVDMKQPE